MLEEDKEFYFDKDSINIQQVGILTKELADLIKSNICPEFNLNECDILIGKNNIEHIKDEHGNILDKYGDKLTEIIKSPDYIGIHPNKKSIELIKQLDKNLLVAIRIKNKSPIWVKSFYDISNDKLQTYINRGTVFKVDYP